ncbi:putative ABC transport system permease protein [Alicyclobacillus hesperidum]|uniref:Putative ABC transport system permease protein n=1 Tax=Alicyclobacillus hesperidum TaxID=89784 RepID=A0A1H2VUV7_9BACL|nr:iron export ABC transporter permease subunit FetB [Alicyclobacillus hesperidum]SDW72076.1 putative ABC transport system permease protein [Alicyclobacillus hesperidum]
MSYLSLSFTLLFVVVSLVLSLWLRLGVERDIVIAAVRAAIQLLVVGYILKFVFASHQTVFILLMVALIIAVAAWNARGRAKGIPGVIWSILIGLVVTEIVTQGLLLGIGVVPFQARYVITITGMIIGNSMVAAGLLLNRLQREVENGRAEITAVLALGGSPKQAIYPRLKQAIRAGMIPTIDSTKTTGLVQLPGMMTGQIIAGADPVQAVRYQLMILFCILAGSAMTSIVIGFLTYPKLFTAHQQLREG